MKYIDVNALSFSYAASPRKTLECVHLSVDKGSIYGFLGPNGAGKTTLLKIILGMIPEYEGHVEVLGQRPGARSVKTRIGFMPEIAHYYGYLTPRELLLMYGRLFGIETRPLASKAEELLVQVGLRDQQDVLMKNFSKGMLQKVSFAQALINDPDLLIFDEPTTGLDPLARIQMRSVIQDFQKSGKTVFFSSHELSEIETICDEVAIIHQGVIVQEGPLKDLLAQKGRDMTLEQYFLRVIGSDIKTHHETENTAV
jgi:ABC-2 type transport system ATP-binding protein